MKTYLIHHIPHAAGQDTWAVSFSLPYIATAYAQAGEGLWYIKTWLSADQIRRRLAILFTEQDEVRIQEAGRDFALINAHQIHWLEGRLEHEESVELPPILGPRAAWDAFQTLIGDLAQPISAALTGSSSRNLRAA